MSGWLLILAAVFLYIRNKLVHNKQQRILHLLINIVVTSAEMHR